MPTKLTKIRWARENAAAADAARALAASCRQAIVTVYRGPTNTRGSRVIARCEAKRISVPWDHALDSSANHAAAAVQLMDQLGWSERNSLAMGGTKRRIRLRADPKGGIVTQLGNVRAAYDAADALISAWESSRWPAQVEKWNRIALHYASLTGAGLFEAELPLPRPFSRKEMPWIDQLVSSPFHTRGEIWRVLRTEPHTHAMTDTLCEDIDGNQCWFAAHTLVAAYGPFRHLNPHATAEPNAIPE